jgi:hypothetical protein
MNLCTVARQTSSTNGLLMNVYKESMCVLLRLIVPPIKRESDTQNAECRIQTTEYRIQTTEYRIQNTKYRKQNIE